MKISEFDVLQTTQINSSNQIRSGNLAAIKMLFWFYLNYFY